MPNTLYSRDGEGYFGIHQIGYSENPSVTRFGPGQRNQYIIHYVLGGEGVYNGNPVREGQGFLIYPRQKEYYHSSPENPWRFLWVIATGELMARVFERYNADPETRIFDFDSFSVLAKSAAYIVENNRKTVDALELTELFLHILNSHIHNADKAKHKPNSEVYTDFCVDYIEKNLHKKITVSELTELLGVSQPYLYTIFRSRYGISLRRYITLAKHERAKKLLADHSLSVTEVANSVGYEDLLAFSKAFKALEGSSPSGFRAEKTSEAASAHA